MDFLVIGNNHVRSMKIPYKWDLRSIDMVQGLKYGAPSEDQTHYSVVINLARQVC